MQVSEKLRHVGLKATSPRLKVLQVFHFHERRHLTAEDVHRRMVETDGDVGLGTVYRVLGQLTDAPHDHLACLACGRVDEFADEVIEKRKRAIAKEHGYALAQHQLALYGYCPDCRLGRSKKAGTHRRS